MTAVIYRWQIFCSIAICLLFANVASATSHVKSSMPSWESQLPSSTRLFETFYPDHGGCSLAGSLNNPTDKSFSNRSTAKPALAVAMPVDIEFDQFSLQRFGQVGLSPQCLFVDHSAPQGYLETRIANTLQPTNHSVYGGVDIESSLLPSETDPYWEYYSDCDAWDVVFARLPSETLRNQESVVSEVLIQFQTFAKSALSNFEQFVYNAKLKEFEQVELEGVDQSVPVSLPAHEILIEKMKDLRPMIRGILKNDFVRNPKLWLEQQKTAIGDCIEGTSLAIVWSSLTQIQFLGRVGVKNPNGIQRRNGLLKDNFSWIARKVQQVVGTMKLR
jgi:hypothetical protein